MMLFASVRSVIRANPATEPPTVIQDAEEQARYLATLSVQIKQIPGATPSSWGTKEYLDIHVSQAGGDGNESARMCVFFDKTGQLQVGPMYHWNGAPLGGIEHLRRLVDAMLERLRRLWRRDKQRTKVRQLQTRSLHAKVDAALARLGLAGEVSCDNRSAALRAHLITEAPERTFTLQIPYDRADEVLASLGPMVDAARELQRCAARCKSMVDIEVQTVPEEKPPRRRRRR